MSTNSDHNAYASRDKLVEDVKVLTKDVQDLLKATASVMGEKASVAREKVESSLKVAQEKLGTMGTLPWICRIAAIQHHGRARR